jgi:hypothetical protein
MHHLGPRASESHAGAALEPRPARILSIFEGAAEIEAQVVCRGPLEGRNQAPA